MIMLTILHFACFSFNIMHGHENTSAIKGGGILYSLFSFLHGDGLLGALAGAHAAAGAGIGHVVLLLQFALDGTELAVLGADGAANAGLLVDLSDLGGLQSLQRAGGASLSALAAAAALVVVDHRQVVLHGDGLKPVSYTHLTLPTN